MDAPTAIDLARAVIGQRTPLGSGDAHDLLGEPAWVGWDADAPVVMVAISMPRRGSSPAPLGQPAQALRLPLTQGNESRINGDDAMDCIAAGRPVLGRQSAVLHKPIPALLTHLARGRG
jgi:hypothetical protein